MLTGYHYTAKMVKILYSGLMGLFDGHHCEERGRCWMTADKADYKKRTPLTPKSPICSHKTQEAGKKFNVNGAYMHSLIHLYMDVRHE